MEDFEPADHGASLQASIERARHWSSIERHDLAREELGRALARWPDIAELHVLLARSFHDEEQHEAALDEAQTALSMEPESVSALSMLSLVLMDMGRHQESEKHILVALSINPSDAHLYLVYGILLYKTGHVKKAEAALRKCLSIDPELSSAHSLLAQVLTEKSKSTREATPHSARGLVLNPDSDMSHVSAGHTALVGGRPFLARRHLREALRIDPTDDTIEEAWLHADKCCRLIYLPYYYWSLLLERLPGGPFAVWGLFIVFAMTAAPLGVPAEIITLVTIAYVAFVLYTWVAELLVMGWLKLRPPQ